MDCAVAHCETVRGSSQAQICFRKTISKYRKNEIFWGCCSVQKNVGSVPTASAKKQKPGRVFQVTGQNMKEYMWLSCLFSEK